MQVSATLRKTCRYRSIDEPAGTCNTPARRVFQQIAFMRLLMTNTHKAC